MLGDFCKIKRDKLRSRSDRGEYYVTTAIVLPVSILILAVLLEIFRVGLLAFSTEELASLSASYFADPNVAQGGVNSNYALKTVVKKQANEPPGLTQDRKLFWTKFLKKNDPDKNEFAAINRSYGLINQMIGKASFPIPDSYYSYSDDNSPVGSGAHLPPGKKSQVHLSGVSCTVNYKKENFLGVAHGVQRLVIATCLMKSPFAGILGQDYLRVERTALVPVV